MGIGSVRTGARPRHSRRPIGDGGTTGGALGTIAPELPRWTVSDRASESEFQPTEKWGFFRCETEDRGMQGNLPPEAQEKIEELQDLQETAQQVAQQKQQAETQLQESRTALETLDGMEGEAQMYREVGELLVETDYEEAYDDLEEKIDSLEVRVETLKKQEERVQEQFESLQEELQQMLQGGAGGAGGGGPMGPGGPGAGGA
jgi:prefoldin beta subunit